MPVWSGYSLLPVPVLLVDLEGDVMRALLEAFHRGESRPGQGGLGAGGVQAGLGDAVVRGDTLEGGETLRGAAKPLAVGPENKLREKAIDSGFPPISQAIKRILFPLSFLGSDLIDLLLMQVCIYGICDRVCV